MAKTSVADSSFSDSDKILYSDNKNYYYLTPTYDLNSEPDDDGYFT